MHAIVLLDKGKDIGDGRGYDSYKMEEIMEEKIQRTQRDEGREQTRPSRAGAGAVLGCLGNACRPKGLA